MTLERIIGASIYGFASGFAYGFFMDRKIGFEQDFEEYAKEGCKGCSKIDKCNLYKSKESDELSSALSKLERNISLTNSFLVGMANAHAKLDIPSYLVATAEAGIATYLGIKAGGAVSKVIRDKAKLNDEEKKTFFNYLKEFEFYAINENDDKAEKALKQVRDYIINITKKKKNPRLLVEMRNLTKEAVLHASIGRMFKEVIISVFDYYGSECLNKKKDKDDKNEKKHTKRTN